MTPLSSKRLNSVQMLRALAAIMVVIYHLLIMLVHNGGYRFSIIDVGAAGVDLFFVISGFVMIYTSAETFNKSQASFHFIKRRLIRILPMYWLYTSVVVMLLIIAPTLFSVIKFDWHHVLFSYLLLLSKNSNGQIGTVMQTGWTLCYEVYFYLLLAILINFPRKYFLITMGVIFLAGVAIGKMIAPLYPWTIVAFDPILFEFYMGTVIAFMYLNGFALPRVIAILFVILAIATLSSAYNIIIENLTWKRVIYWGLPCGFLLYAVVSLERTQIKIPQWILALGDSSYSLYLVHPFIIPAFGKLWFALHLAEKISPIIPFGITLISTLLIAHMLYLYIENPTTHWLNKRWRKKSPKLDIKMDYAA